MIVKTGEKITHVVSQSAVIQFLAQNHHSFDSILNNTVEDRVLKDGMFQVQSGFTPRLDVDSDDDGQPGSMSALDTFRLMFHKKVSSLPIITRDHTILSTIASRDLKLLFVEKSLDPLLLPVEDYVAGVRRLNVQVEGFPYIVVETTSSYEKVLLKVNATKVQRLYIINEERVPVGVVTLKDILHRIGTSL